LKIVKQNPQSSQSGLGDELALALEPALELLLARATSIDSPSLAAAAVVAAAVSDEISVRLRRTRS
jgi:hypothetical protein